MILPLKLPSIKENERHHQNEDVQQAVEKHPPANDSDKFAAVALPRMARGLEHVPTLSRVKELPAADLLTGRLLFFIEFFVKIVETTEPS